jgi:hypothetical protein
LIAILAETGMGLNAIGELILGARVPEVVKLRFVLGLLQLSVVDVGVAEEPPVIIVIAVVVQADAVVEIFVKVALAEELKVNPVPIMIAVEALA